MAIERDPNQDPQISRAANESRGHESHGPDAASMATEQSLWPLIEAFRVRDKFVVQADLPGMQADDVVVELTETDLIISGERVRSARADSQTYQQERSFGRFRRRVRLPEGVRPATVRATVENGVLGIEFEMNGKSVSQRPPPRVHVQQGKPN
jgi:HSP20 family molecular chaperone IbpA